MDASLSSPFLGLHRRQSTALSTTNPPTRRRLVSQRPIFSTASQHGPAPRDIRRSVILIYRGPRAPPLNQALTPPPLGALEIAIIGGTGLTKLPSFQLVAELPLTHPALITPWGSPSAPITVFSHPRPAPQPPLNVAFLARHGATHQYAPHEVPSRANIAALRKLGVRCVLAFSAVGSLKEEVRPRDFVVPDQVIDRTKGVRPIAIYTQPERGLLIRME